MIVKEGKITIEIPEIDYKRLSSKVEVFYNPLMSVNRDISVLLLEAHSKILGRKLRVLDSMAASGIRSLRFLLETDVIDTIYVNDISKKAIEYIRKNFERYKKELGEKDVSVVISCEDARVLMYSERFDFIDIDPFGSPLGFIEPAVLSLKRGGMLAVTATDTGSLNGSKNKAGWRKYGVKLIKTDFLHEVGVRALIKKIIEIASQFDIAMIPVFSYYYKHHYRVFFMKRKGAKRAEKLLESLGWILYNQETLERKVSYEYLKEEEFFTLGPIYLGSLWDGKYIEILREIYRKKDIQKETIKILERIFEEWNMNIPWYYDLRFFFRRYKVKSPKKIEEYLKKVKGVRTHFSDSGIRTEADFNLLLDAILQ